MLKYNCTKTLNTTKKKKEKEIQVVCSSCKNQYMTLKQTKISFLQTQFGNRVNNPINSWELKCSKSSSALQ